VLGHWKICPQLFVTVIRHLPAQGVTLSGVQQPPSGRHWSPGFAHEGAPPAPHETV
jgi:hypothetical protein